MRHKRDQTSPLKTILVISMGFLLLSIIFNNNWGLWISSVIGITGLVSKYFAAKIEAGWFTIARVLGLILPKVILGAVFYLILSPIATFSKLFRGKYLVLTNEGKSNFKNCDKSYYKEGFENPW